MVIMTVTAAAAILACTDVAGISPQSARTDTIPGAIVVSPNHLQGWSLRDDQHDSACTVFCSFVNGPGTPPAGSGSAELTLSGTADGYALVLQQFQGTRLDAITDLSYSTYRQSSDPGNNLAIALQLNVDYDLADQTTSYQGRLVYEPYQSQSGQIMQGTWQRWNALEGKWWGTKSTVSKNGASVGNPCVQSHPCSLSELLTAFPNLGIHSLYGAVILKAGSGWTSFRGNVDGLTIGVGQSSTTYDFELADPQSVSLLPPDSVPHALFDSLGTVASTKFPSEGPYIRDIIAVVFLPGTSLAARQAAIDSVGGRVVGGKLSESGLEGTYFIQISGGTLDALVHAVLILQRQPQVGLATRWNTTIPDKRSYLRPIDGDGWKSWKIDPSSPDISRANWALEYIRMPMAWGCSVGNSRSAAAVVDFGIPVNRDVAANVDTAASAVSWDWTASDSTAWSNGSSIGDHGARVASVMAAVGNDGYGMTGVAWRTRLILRDAGASGTRDQTPLVRETNDLIAAGLDGASVINVSLAVQWRGKYDPSSAEDSTRISENRATVTNAIRALASRSIRPLFVICAATDSGQMEMEKSWSSVTRRVLK